MQRTAIGVFALIEVYNGSLDLCEIRRQLTQQESLC